MFSKSIYLFFFDYPIHFIGEWYNKPMQMQFPVCKILVECFFWNCLVSGLSLLLKKIFFEYPFVLRLCLEDRLMCFAKNCWISKARCTGWVIVVQNSRVVSSKFWSFSSYRFTQIIHNFWTVIFANGVIKW